MIKVSRVPGFTSTHAPTLTDDVSRGLWSTPKTIAPRNFYDERGSELFAAITELPEYYLTRVETAIIRGMKSSLPLFSDNTDVDIIELGSGCSEKTWLILDAFTAAEKTVCYRPIDISLGAMTAMEDTFAERYRSTSKLHMHGLLGPYSEAIDILRHEQDTRQRNKLILFLGSNIGNMSFDEAIEFLLEIHLLTKPTDRVVVGFDRKKDLRVLQAAYDDSRGITREFNFNLLDRMNAELGANFERTAFFHHAFYDPLLEGMVSWLISKTSQYVTIPALNGAVIHFREGEGIRTELSRKYSLDDINILAHRSKFVIESIMSDEKNWFSVAVLAPR